MADENPLKLPPPVIGNPFIGDIGRGKLSDSPQPRRPAIPFVLWYGADEPVFTPPSTDAPPRPVIVTADGPITAPMVGYNIIKTMVSPPERQLVPPVIVGAQQSPNHQTLPYVFAEQPLDTAVAAPSGTPLEPVVVVDQASPNHLQQPFTFVERPFDAAVAAPSATPARPLVVNAVEAPWSRPQVLIAAIQVAADVPAKVLVARAIELPWAAQQAFIFAHQPKVFAAAPVAGDKAARPIIVSDLRPPQPVDQILVWTVVSDSDATPPRATVVVAGPQPVEKPFTFVSKGAVSFVAPPAVPVKPTMVGAQPVPPEYGQSKTAHGFATAVAPTETPVPVIPTVVPAQPFPQPTQPPQSFLARVAPPPPPQIIMRPIVVPAQPLPMPYVQAPWINFTEADPPQVPIYPTVVGQQPIPPQLPFMATPKGGRWGDPPPTHRIIQPQVVTDMSLPFRPNGWVRVAHGFAEALPLLFEGTVTGGVLDGSTVTGGVGGGAGITGGQQNGYVTGGVR